MTAITIINKLPGQKMSNDLNGWTILTYSMISLGQTLFLKYTFWLISLILGRSASRFKSSMSPQFHPCCDEVSSGRLEPHMLLIPHPWNWMRISRHEQSNTCRRSRYFENTSSWHGWNVGELKVCRSRHN